MQKFLDFMKKHIGLWRFLAILFALIFMLGFVIGGLLEDNKSQVNRVLKTRTETIEADEELYTLYTPKDDYNQNTDNLLKDHIDIGTRLSQEGSVLLQNEENALPLVTDSTKLSDLKITLFGIGSSYTGSDYGMPMGGTLDDSQSISLHDALENRGADVNDAMDDYYEAEAQAAPSGTNSVPQAHGILETAGKYVPYEVQPKDDYMTGYSKTDAGSGKTSVGIVVVSRDSTESGDYFPGEMGIDTSTYGARNPLSLTTDELNVIKYANNNCDKVIVLINSSNPVEVGPIMTGADNAVDAIMWIGFPGNYGYYGVADCLLGNTNPSGRLADTFASDTVSSPAMQNFGIYQYDGIDHSTSYYNTYLGQYYVVEAESIYTGYKYYETRYEDTVLNKGSASSTAGTFDSANGWTYGEEVNYSFGYGLSYTTFEQSIDTSAEGTNGTGLKLSSDGRTLTVYYKVTNTGDVAGRSVVQVYGQSPYYEDQLASTATTENGHSKIEKAAVQLLNYAKTPEIAAGNSVTGSIDIDLELLASYDTDDEGTYVMEAGTYYIALGNNGDMDGSHAAINNILAVKDKDATLDTTKANTDAVTSFTWGDSEDRPTSLFATTADGVAITNQLDNADLNYYMGKKAGNSTDYVTYLSRSDWTWNNDSNWANSKNISWARTDTDGNIISNIGYKDIKATDAMAKQLENETYTIGGDSSAYNTDMYDTDTKFDQDNGLTFYDVLEKNDDGTVKIGDDGLPVVAEYNDEVWTKLMEELNLQEGLYFIAEGNRNYHALSGINFVGGTITENGPTGVALTLNQTLDVPWMPESTDMDGYTLGDTGCATLQAATFDQDLLEEVGELWGNDSLFSQLPVLWAPSLNVHRTPYNGRSGEYYSEDAIVSGYSAASICQGGAKYGLIGTIKHFAFNDQEANRNGLSVYLSEQQGRENELRGFQIAIGSGALGVMTSFNRVGCTYSGASTGLMQGILRGEWEYKGYAVSDYFSSGNYMRMPESVLAGTTNFDALATAESSWGTQIEASTYANDTVMQRAIKTSVHEALYAFAHSNMMNYMTPTAKSVNINNWWRSTYTALEVIGGVVAGLALVAFIIGFVAPSRKDKEA